MSAVTDAGAEREIDLGRWKQAIVDRWWIVVAGVVAGVILGALYSLSGGSVWQASVMIAPGQPFSPSGAPVLTYQASPRSINVLVTSESALERAAAAAHVPIGTIRGHVTTESIATGLGSAGPQATATGTTSVADPTAPLATQNLPFPVQAGQLVVSVTDPTGGRTNATVAIDPSTNSLNDVAAAITAATGGNVTASVDPTSHVLKFDAAAGYTFDFAGRDTNPAGGGAVANPDTANVLSGLGVNGLFTGTATRPARKHANINCTAGIEFAEWIATRSPAVRPWPSSHAASCATERSSSS